MSYIFEMAPGTFSNFQSRRSTCLRHQDLIFTAQLAIITKLSPPSAYCFVVRRNELIMLINEQITAITMTHSLSTAFRSQNYSVLAIQKTTNRSRGFRFSADVLYLISALRTLEREREKKRLAKKGFEAFESLMKSVINN